MFQAGGTGGFDSPLSACTVGKEGMQTSLAAGFSVIQFSHLTKLLTWHRHSSKLAQFEFVIHRGLVISLIWGACGRHTFERPVWQGAHPVELEEMLRMT